MRGATLAIRTALALVPFAPIAASGQSAGKPVVAVAHMKDSAQTGQGQALETMIRTAITETGKFRVIERDFSELDAEQALANSGKVTTRTPGRVGGYAGVDFIVQGTITSASGGQQADSGANTARRGGNVLLKHFGLSDLAGGGGSTCSRAVSSLAVDVKIVDTKTGENAFAKQITQRTATKTSCSGSPALDTTSLMRDVANQTATGLATAMYPIQVAAVQSDGTIILNYGEGALAPNVILAVYGKTEHIPDPANGGLMAVDGPFLGMIRVTGVTNRISKAVPFSPFAAPAATGSVVREATPEQLGASRGKGHR